MRPHRFLPVLLNFATLVRAPRISSNTTPPLTHISSNTFRASLTSVSSPHPPLTDQLHDASRATPASADELHDAITATATPTRALELALDALSPTLTLTPALVADVLHRLRYDEKLALRFFTWAAHRPHYTHHRDAYTAIIDILSSTRYKTRQFGVLCDVLHHLKLRTNPNPSLPTESLLSILKSYADNHLAHLHKFAKKKRIKPKHPPELDAFNLLLDALCKCSLATEAETMFHRMKSRIKPNAETYNILFFGWCRVRDPKKAMNVLEEMINAGHAPENFTYNAAIDAFCGSGMVAEAMELFEFMRTKGSTVSSPIAKTYCLMIVALAKADMMDECFRLLADMRKSGCLPDVSTYEELIEGMCSAGKLDAAYKILEEMGKKGYPPDILTYNCFLKVLCNLRKPEEALRLCDRMIEVGCEPSVHTYHMMMTMFFDIGEPERAADMWDEMERRGCSRVVETYGIMIDGLFGCDQVQEACSLLDEVIDRGLKLPYKKFDALMLRLSAIGNLRAIHRLSDHMRKFYNVAMARRFAVTQKKKSMSLRRK